MEAAAGTCCHAPRPEAFNKFLCNEHIYIYIHIDTDFIDRDSDMDSD